VPSLRAHPLYDRSEAHSIIAPEGLPGFVVRTEAQKVASDDGFGIERGIRSGWLRYASVTAHGEIGIAGVSLLGLWPLSIEHPGVAAELTTLPPSPLPDLATFDFSSFTARHTALDRVDKPGVSLANAPLMEP
jgi:hypothetical protein